MLTDDASRRTDGVPQRERQHQLAFEAVAAHAFNGQGFDFDAVLRHDTRFHRALAAQPHHFVPAFAQRGSHRQRGEDMPAGAAGHQQKGFHAHIRLLTL